MKKLFLTVLSIFSLFLLASCDINELINSLTKKQYDINYYIDFEYIEFEPVFDGEKIILDLDKIYIIEHDCYLDDYIETKETEHIKFDYWYTDTAYTQKATADMVVTEEINLYGRFVDNTPQTPNPDNPNHNHTGIVDDIIYDDFQIHFLEVGNEYTGDSTYIKAGDTDILIDAGSRKNSAVAIKEYVDKYCKDKKLEYVIGTHGDQDHIAGFVGSVSGSTRTGILYQYEVGTIITASLSNKTSQIFEDYLTAIDYAQNKGANVLDAGSCYNNENGGQRVYQLAPDITLEIIYNYYYFNESEDENNYSVCVMLNYKDNHFMLTGDLELEGEEEMAKYYDGSTSEKTLPKVKLFKAGHHGSKTSSNECLLKMIQPEIVCICCCAGSTEYTPNYNNIFPTQDMITRVAKYTDRIYVTTVFNEKTLKFESLNGNIIISSNAEAVGVSATNNIIKLKDTAWFNETIYVDKDGNICSGKGKEDFFISTSPGVTAVKRRVWPTA